MNAFNLIPILLVSAVALGSGAYAADGTWVGAGTPGNWTNASSWSGGTIADGAGSTAYFTGDISADTTIALGANRVIGNIVFSDNGLAGSAWSLTENTLTLAGTTPTITTFTDATIASVIAGTAGLTKTGAATLTLTGTNTYTGDTIIEAGGTLRIGNGGTAGSIASANIINNGTLSYSRSDSIDITAAISGSGSIIGNAGGGKIGIRGPVSAGSITLTSSFSGYGQTLYGSSYASGINLFTDTITTTGDQTYNGVVSIGRGVNGVTTLRTTGGGAVTITNGVIGGLSGYWSSNTLNIETFEGGGAVNLGATPAGIRYGVGNLNINSGTGLITLSGGGYYYDYSVFSGNVALGADVRFVKDDNRWVRGITFNGDVTGDHVLTVSFGTGGGSSTGTGTAGLIFNTATTQTISSRLAGTAGPTKTGSGVTVFSGDNSYTGSTTVQSGALTIRHANALGAISAGTSVASGAALQIEGGITTANEALSLSGTGISNGGALRNLSGDNTYSGAISLLSASRINSDSGTLRLTGGISGAAKNLNFGGTGGIVVSGAIGTTTGALTKDGSGTLTLSGANTYSGGTTVSGGRLVTANAGALGTGSVRVGSGATLQIGDGAVNGVTLGSGASLVVDGTLVLGGIDSTIGLAGGGFDFTNGILDLGGVFDGAPGLTEYQLITGSFAGTTFGTTNVIGFDRNVYGSVVLGNDGRLVFSPSIPEPSTYGLLGAGAIAAVAFVRRRRKP